MDGIHDLGGIEGFGPVVADAREPVFASEWEARAWGVTMGTFVLGLSNGAQFRHSIERMDPAHYLTSRYYEHWVTSVATRLVETDRVTVAELEARAGGPVPLARPMGALDLGPAMATSSFVVGDRVRVIAGSRRGHTRCPRYVRDKPGIVVRIDRPSALPDLELAGEQRKESIYSVAFEATDLWGLGAEHHTVHVDLWASYLKADPT